MQQMKADGNWNPLVIHWTWKKAARRPKPECDSKLNLDRLSHSKRYGRENQLSEKENRLNYVHRDSHVGELLNWRNREGIVDDVLAEKESPMLVRRATTTYVRKLVSVCLDFGQSGRAGRSNGLQRHQERYCGGRKSRWAPLWPKPVDQ